MAQVQVYVYDRNSGSPLFGVIVSVAGRGGRTDRAGSARVSVPDQIQTGIIMARIRGYSDETTNYVPGVTSYSIGMTPRFGIL